MPGKINAAVNGKRHAAPSGLESQAPAVVTFHVNSVHTVDWPTEVKTITNNGSDRRAPDLDITPVFTEPLRQLRETIEVFEFVLAVLKSSFKDDGKMAIPDRVSQDYVVAKACADKFAAEYAAHGLDPKISTSSMGSLFFPGLYSDVSNTRTLLSALSEVKPEEIPELLKFATAGKQSLANSDDDD